MTQAAAPQESPLIYPVADAPGVGDGSMIEVAEGLFWLRMPLGPFLRFINLWAIPEEDGWTVIDTGLSTEETRFAWGAALAGPMGAKPVRRVICTHLHPDHAGLAGWFAQAHAAELWMSRADYLLGQVLLAETTATSAHTSFVRRCGWDDAQIARYVAEFGQFRKVVHPLPPAYRRIKDGDVIETGAYRWRAIEGSGHTPEHICLYDAERRVLISGDQVLPRISSNVSVSQREPEADPLGDWLASLARMKLEVPDAGALVLPSHNDPFIGLHTRLDQLVRRHHDGLDAVEALLDQPRRAVDVFPALFSRPIGPEVLGLATGEAMAHLAHLCALKRATRSIDAEGVAWFSRRSPS